jgi:hypothetical protein
MPAMYQNRVRPLELHEQNRTLTLQPLRDREADAHHQREVHYDKSTQVVSMRTHEYRETTARELTADPLLTERIRRGSLELVALAVEKVPEIRAGGSAGAWLADGRESHSQPKILKTRIDPSELDKVVQNLHDDVYLYTRKKPQGVSDDKVAHFQNECQKEWQSIQRQLCMCCMLFVVMGLIFTLMTGSMGN